MGHPVRFPHQLKSMMIRLSYILLFVSILTGCRHPASPVSKIDNKIFKAYWNQGKAELSSYALDQTLDGHHYPGTSVMTFVPEDFSRSKQFKIDEPKKHPNDDVKVMKLSMSKQFITGINPYDFMTSVFLPLDYDKDPHSLKWVASVQDWNGQWFVQGNWKGHRYEVNTNSYFESEGDTRSTIVNTFLEDEIWTKIRVSPNTLPVGKFNFVPGASYLRLTHTPIKAYNAIAAIQSRDSAFTYILQYPDLKRKLEISFESVFPYKILEWTETYGQNEVTKGKLMKTLMDDFWNHNLPENADLRRQLNLPAD